MFFFFLFQLCAKCYCKAFAFGKKLELCALYDLFDEAQPMHQPGWNLYKTWGNCSLGRIRWWNTASKSRLLSTWWRTIMMIYKETRQWQLNTIHCGNRSKTIVKQDCTRSITIHGKQITIFMTSRWRYIWQEDNNTWQADDNTWQANDNTWQADDDTCRCMTSRWRYLWQVDDDIYDMQMTIYIMTNRWRHIWQADNNIWQWDDDIYDK